MTMRIDRCHDALAQIAKIAERSKSEFLTEDLALARLHTIEAIAKEAQLPVGIFEQLSDQMKRVK
jgi:hypothetical protein